MQKILISSCLLGEKVRYDGQGKGIAHPQISTWLQEGRLVKICPEVSGGLPTPRARAERRGNQVISEFDDDVSVQFLLGARKALALCKAHNIQYALLKEFSPSCGANHIYDGQFAGNKIVGQGITAEFLTDHGINVFSELEISRLLESLRNNG